MKSIYIHYGLGVSSVSLRAFTDIHITKEIVVECGKPQFVCTVTAKWSDSHDFMLKIGTNVGYAEIDGEVYHATVHAYGEPMLEPWEDCRASEAVCKRNLLEIAKIFDEVVNLKTFRDVHATDEFFWLIDGEAKHLCRYDDVENTRLVDDGEGKPLGRPYHYYTYLFDVKGYDFGLSSTYRDDTDIAEVTDGWAHTTTPIEGVGDVKSTTWHGALFNGVLALVKGGCKDCDQEASNEVLYGILNHIRA